MSPRRSAILAPLAVCASVLALVVGMSASSSGARSLSAAPTRPTATVTQTVTATATVTQTVTATATVTEPGPTTTVTAPGPTVTVTADPPSSSATATQSSTPTATSTPTPTPTATATQPPASGAACTSDNAFTNWNGDKYDWPGLTSDTDTNGAGSMGEYYVTEDEWGAGGTGLVQHSVFCAKPDGSPYFYAEANTPAGADGSVKSYPNAHLDFHHWGTGAEPPLSDVDNNPNTPNSLTTTWAHQSPATCTGCSYDWSHELWLNNYAVEVMIWTDYKVQHPRFGNATLQDTVTLNGYTWEVWRAVWGGTGTSRDGYIVFLPANNNPITSGTFNMLAFGNYVAGKGWAGANPTLSSVTYGVEVCQTGGATKRFDVTDFSVSPLPHLVY